MRKHAIELATLLDANEHIGEMIYDWNEPGKVLRVEIAQDKARQLGLSSEDVANVMNSIVSGTPITQVNDNIYLINVVARAEDSERGSPDTLQNLQILTPTAPRSRCWPSPPCATSWNSPGMAPRPQANHYHQGLGQRRHPAYRPVAQLKPEIDQFIDKLPVGYEVATGGTVEESAKAQGPIRKVIPLMLFLMATFLMIQLHSVQKLFPVVSVAPLGLIGVVLALVPTGTPMGFVAILGILALAGIIIRNSVIPVTQIDEFEAQGFSPWDAVVEATNHRRRPILLTAAAASLGMIPIAREVFWGRWPTR